jgi:hypothetical protein
MEKVIEKNRADAGETEMLTAREQRGRVRAMSVMERGRSMRWRWKEYQLVFNAMVTAAFEMGISSRKSKHTWLPSTSFLLLPGAFPLKNRLAYSENAEGAGSGPCCGLPMSNAMGPRRKSRDRMLDSRVGIERPSSCKRR